MTTVRRAYGDQGEEAAIRFLVREGYHLLERNWRIGHLEIDIIAEIHGLLVFVEVKTRSDGTNDDAAEAVNHTKQGHLLEAAREYTLLHHLDNPMRFDIITVVGVEPPFTVRHIPNAFSAASYANVERARFSRKG